MKTLKKADEVSFHKYNELVKTVARIEYARLSSSAHLLDFSEIINIGATTVYVILSSQPEACHNNTYISTAIKWAIRNELRRRYKWYSLRHASDKGEEEQEFPNGIKKEEVREAVYETILSIEEMMEAENPVQIEDFSCSPEQKLELSEIAKAIRKAIEKLPEKEKQVVEARFYKNKRVKEIASEYNVTSSRISKIIQNALDRIKNQLTAQEMI